MAESRPLDIPLAVASLVPNAQYRKAGTYPDLQATWTDARPIPTFGQINTAWAQLQAQINKTEARQNRGRRLVELIGEGDRDLSILRLAEAIDDPIVALDVKAKLAQAKSEHPDPTP